MYLFQKFCSARLIIDSFLRFFSFLREFVQPGLDQQVLVLRLLYCHLGVVHFINATQLPRLRRKYGSTRVQAHLIHLVLEFRRLTYRLSLPIHRNMFVTIRHRVQVRVRVLLHRRGTEH